MSGHSKTSHTTEAAASTTDTTEVMKLLDQVITQLGLTTQPLTTKQRKAAARSRKGMERVIPTLASLSTEHGVSVPKQPTSTMTSNLERAQQLEAVQAKLNSAIALVASNADSTRSASWTTATTLYGMLQKVAHRDVQLKTQMAPVTQFFAFRTPEAKKRHPKQKGKKAALAAASQTTEKPVVEVADAQATPPSSTPSNGGSAAGSTNGAQAPAPNGTTTHA